jgi:hypothetical protein
MSLISRCFAAVPGSRKAEISKACRLSDWAKKYTWPIATRSELEEPGRQTRTPVLPLREIHLKTA